MKGTNFKYFIIFVLFLIFSLPLQGKIIIEDCNGSVMDPKRERIARKHKENAERVLTEINSNKCLPPSWLNPINYSGTSKKYQIQIKLNCDQNFNCGTGDITSDVITVPKYYFSWQQDCGCEEATILHEMLHVYARVPDTNDGHKKIKGCEVKCTSKIPKCQKYPPPGGGFL